MQSLGNLGKASSAVGFGNGVNTHQWVVGSSNVQPDEEHGNLPFLWTPNDGLQRLQTLGGNGIAVTLNELGQIAGTTFSAQGALRATLWTPAAGPLAVAAESAAPSGER